MLAMTNSSPLPSNVSTTRNAPHHHHVKRVILTFVTFGLLTFVMIAQLLEVIHHTDNILQYLRDATVSVPTMQAFSPSNKNIDDGGGGGGGGIQWKNRNYMTHPVTATESSYITNTTVENAKRMKNQTNSSSPLKVAVCHPTMFGNLSLDTHFAWASYYRLLGFDHIFLWYEEDVSKRPRFDELEALPYVTLTPYDGGSREVYHGQRSVERECFAMANHTGFDWALAIDVDEYIWFQKPQSIQDFLAHYEQQNITYISLGKHHYSTRHAYNGTTTSTSTRDAGFGLEQYPYTPGPYCYGNRGSSHCPNWMGRCKVLAKPSKFESVLVHGINNHHNAPDGTHLDTSVAHFKEWNNLVISHQYNHHHDALGNDDDSIVYHNDTQSFQSDSTDAGIYWLVEAHTVNAAGMVTIYNDGDKLHEWFQFVARGAMTNQHQQH